ncbi:TonB-dependent receptor [Hymenobacter sp.]|uniref:TonB-dependent receptor n=1 Tax=Hymenobacter sp. TaxID=1898978 RepID=UPI00286B9E49|nr:TonB-dependent receptor [Hymenobacter sp.]
MKKFVILPRRVVRLKQLVLGPALLAGVAFGARAQAPADTLQRQSLTEVVVTATRSATARDKVPQQIQVISRPDIQATPNQEFTDVLKKNASVDIVQYSSLLAGVGIRGFRPQTSGLNQRTLLLVDGRPAGTTNLATLDLGSAEQVEVLKGPASALYGSQAMGGVVNVVTRQSRGAVRSSLFAEYGSYQTFRVGGATGGNITKGLDFDLSFGLFDRAADIKLGRGGLFRPWLAGGRAIKTYADGTTQNTDDDRADGQRRAFTKLGYYSGALRLGYQLSEHWRVDVRGERFVARNVQAPNDVFYGDLAPSSKDIGRQNLDLSATGDYAHHQLFVRGYTSGETNDNNTLADDRNVLIAPYRSFQSQYLWRGVQVKDVVKLGHQRLTVGVDRNEATSNSQRFNVSSTAIAPFNPNYELNTTGLYAQGQLSFWQDKLLVTPGARYDFITYRGKPTDLLTTFTPGQTTNPFFSPSLGAQYALVEGLNAHGTIGRAYVTPEAYNVAGYSQTAPNAMQQVAVTQGNPDLKNEQSVTWDAGLRFDRPATGLSADVTYFATRVKDRIFSRPTRPVGETTPEGYLVLTRTVFINADDSRIRGLEASTGYDFGALAESRYSLRVFAGGTKIFKAEDVVSSADGTQTTRAVFNVASLSGNFGVAYDSHRGLRARLAGHYVGHRRDLDFTEILRPQVEYPRYLTLDFSAGYTVAEKHTFSLLVNNLTDENYYEKRGYNLPGRNVAGRYTLSF